MGIAVRLTTEHNGDICLQSPYDRQFVEDLKFSIPYDARSWDPTRRRWIILALYTDDLLSFLTDAGATVQDDRESVTARTMTATPAMPRNLRHAFDVLHLAYTAPLGGAEAMFKFLARHSTHDDVGGPINFHAINDAISTIRSYLNPKSDDADDSIPF